MTNNLSLNVDKLFISKPCKGASSFTTQFLDHGGKIFSNQSEVSFKLKPTNKGLSVHWSQLPEENSLAFVLGSLEALFGQNPDLQKLWVDSSPLVLQKVLCRTQSSFEILRTDFFQIPGLWVHNSGQALGPERWINTKETLHPERPPVVAEQVLYQRTVPHLDVTLRFRVVHPEKDLDIFHEWHNQERVFEFWELNKPKTELQTYLEKALQDPHQFPVIVEIDDVPVGYFEMYWVKEDRLGPYYDSEAFDRGFHFLIGNSDYLGFNNTDAILKAVCHYLFLEEPRTRKIMAEPRSDNKKILRYLETFTAWKKLKEFDFPHKRAALLECRREAFFLGNYL